jgi:uncharacterized membrane protein YphA (DoxX/SURF4 family)
MMSNPREWLPGKNQTIARYTWRVLQAVTGLVFLYAGLTKIGDPHAFLESVSNMRISNNEHFLFFTAYFLPPLEIVTGAGLILNWQPIASRTIVTILLVVFCAILIHAQKSGLDINCGCFGKSLNIQYHQHILLNLGLIAGATGYAIHRWLYPETNKK